MMNDPPAYPQSEVLHIFADGQARQMKNTFLFDKLEPLRQNFKFKTLTWSIFTASHGKRPVDGVGGQTKQIV
jgi:hypothetical protein